MMDTLFRTILGQVTLDQVELRESSFEMTEINVAYKNFVIERTPSNDWIDVHFENPFYRIVIDARHVIGAAVDKTILASVDGPSDSVVAIERIISASRDVQVTDLPNGGLHFLAVNLLEG